MGVITFTSCFIQNFTHASYFSGMFLGFKVRRKKKRKWNIIDVPVPQNSSYGEAGTLLEYDSIGANSCFDYSL